MPKDTITDIKLHITDGKPVELPSGEFVANAQMTREGMDLHLTSPDGHAIIVEGYFAQSTPPDLFTHDGARLSPALVDSFVPPERVGQYAAAGGGMSDESPAGKITEISGDATIVRADGTKIPASVGAAVYQGDVVETSKTGAVNIQFADNTTFAISESARMSVDKFIYDLAHQSGSSFFSMLQGVFVYTSGLIGKADPGNVNIETPVGSIGIRGTVVAGQIAAAGHESKITILDGAITFTNGAGTHEMHDSYNTVALSGYQQSPTDMGHMDAQTFNSTFKAIASVANDTVSHFSANAPATSDAPAQGNGTAPAQGATPEGNAPAGHGGKTEGAPAPADGAAPPAGAAAPAGQGAEAAPAGVAPATQTAAHETVGAPAAAAPATMMAPAPVSAPAPAMGMSANNMMATSASTSYGTSTMGGGTMANAMSGMNSTSLGTAPAGTAANTAYASSGRDTASTYGSATGNNYSSTTNAANNVPGTAAGTGRDTYVPPATNTNTTINNNTTPPFQLTLGHTPEYNNPSDPWHPGVQQFAKQGSWTGLTIVPSNAVGAVTYQVAVNLATPVYNIVPTYEAKTNPNIGMGGLTATSLLTGIGGVTVGDQFFIQAGIQTPVYYTIIAGETVANLIGMINTTAGFHAELTANGHLQVSLTTGENMIIGSNVGSAAINIFGSGNMSTLVPTHDFHVININNTNAFTVDANGHILVNDTMMLSHFVNPNGINLTVTATDSVGHVTTFTPHFDIRDDLPGVKPIIADTNLNGTASADILVLTGTANLNVSGGGGTDVIIGNDGNNTINIIGTDFKLIDGGMGMDTLKLGSSTSVTADYNDANVLGEVHNIERIDLGQSAGNMANTVRLSVADVFDMTDGNHTLTVSNASGAKTGNVVIYFGTVGDGAWATDHAFQLAAADSGKDMFNAGNVVQDLHFEGTYHGQAVTLVIHQEHDASTNTVGGVGILSG